MAGGEVVTNGDIQAVASEQVVQHVVHVGVAILGLIVSEAAHDDATHMTEHALEPQLGEHASHARNALAHVFKEEYDVAIVDVVTVEEVPLLRAREVDAEHRHVAAQQDALSRAQLVVGMCRHVIGGQLAA